MQRASRLNAKQEAAMAPPATLNDPLGQPFRREGAYILQSSTSADGPKESTVTAERGKDSLLRVIPDDHSTVIWLFSRAGSANKFRITEYSTDDSVGTRWTGTPHAGDRVVRNAGASRSFTVWETEDRRLVIKVDDADLVWTLADQDDGTFIIVLDEPQPGSWRQNFRWRVVE